MSFDLDLKKIVAELIKETAELKQKFKEYFIKYPKTEEIK